jgi:phospholipase A1
LQCSQDKNPKHRQQHDLFQKGNLLIASLAKPALWRMNNAMRCAVFLLPLFLPDIARAAGDTDQLQTCLDMQGKAGSDQTLDCYNRAAQTLLGKTSEQTARPARNRPLAEEWTATDELIRVYKQNYFLFYSHSSQPNNTPTSTNPDNQVPASYSLDNKEMKFQVSIKGHLLGKKRHSLWFGYTQLSFWQIYDTEHSTPFRENNYEPELIYSYHPEHPLRTPGMNTSLLNVGIVHQSNGQTLPRSRAWNREYIQVGLERDFGEHGKLTLLPRWWKRIGSGTPQEDDNPDITRYLGYGDLEARYYRDQFVLCALIKRHSLQLDIAIPAPEILDLQLQNTNLHLQLFDGYGESLIDYNQRHRTIGLGLSMPFE